MKIALILLLNISITFACNIQIEQFTVAQYLDRPLNSKQCLFLEGRIVEIVKELRKSDKTQQQNQELYRNSQMTLSIQVQQIRIEDQTYGQVFINTF